MQIKPQWDIISVIRMAIIFKDIIFARGVEKNEPSPIIGSNVNWYSHYGKKYECS